MNRKVLGLSLLFIVILVIPIASISFLKFKNSQLPDPNDFKNTSGKHSIEFNEDSTSPDEEISISKAEELDSPSLLGYYSYKTTPIHTVNHQLEIFKDRFDNIVKNDTWRNAKFTYRTRSRFHPFCNVTVNRLIEFDPDYQFDKPTTIRFRSLMDIPNTNRTVTFRSNYSNKFSKVAFIQNETWVTKGGREDTDEFSYHDLFSNVYLVESNIYYSQWYGGDGGITFWIEQVVVLDQDYFPLLILYTRTQADD